MGPLVTPEWLAERLGNSDLRVADVRWYLDDPDRGRRQYLRAHLPGAVFLDLEEDLSAPQGPGRHPLPDPARLAARLGGVGIGDRHAVVAYDASGGAVAARLWWLLRHLGHERVAVLDGGYPAWRRARLPVTDEVPAFPPATFTPRARAGGTIERSELLDRLGEVVLLDARDPERYRGETEPVDPVAGHIPTARNAPFRHNLGPDGRFLPASELAERYRALGVGLGASVVASCGSGVTACHDLLALEVAGLGEGILYPGSWSDWSAAGLPAVTGPDPGEPP